MTPEEREQFEAAKRAGEAEAAKLTVEERARRFRAMCLVLVEAAFPPLSHRLARREIERLSDERCVELAEMALGCLLAPGETA